MAGGVTPIHPLDNSSLSVWGKITGTLSAQTDLQSVLNLKAPVDSPVFTNAVSEAMSRIIWSATPVLTVACNANYIVLSGNTTSTLAAGVNGQRMTIIIAQDATGGRTWTWPSNVRGGGTISLAPSSVSVQSFIYHTVWAKWIATCPMLTGI